MSRLARRARARRDSRRLRLGPSDDLSRLVVPVPSSSVLDDDHRTSVVDRLAEALAAAGAGECRRGLVVKSGAVPSLRHLDPGHRAEAAAAAGYRAAEPVTGRHVVVVDDVVLTGTTLRAVAACLYEAGAASVTAAVAARSRLR